MLSNDNALISPTTTPASLSKGWAWGICWLMFASTILNYMDRQALSLVGPQIKTEFHLDNTGFGWVMAVFSLTYAVSQIAAGFLVDRWDLRKTYAGSVTWWSLAGIATAFSPTLSVLLVCRALLGVGESFNWPCALGVTARILPPADRSLGNGIFNSGAAFGAVLAPIVVTLLAARFGWRTPFIAVGSLGFVWTAAWLFLVRGERAELLRAGHHNPNHSNAVRDQSQPTITSKARIALIAVVAASVLVALSAFRVGTPALWWSVATLRFGLLLAARLLSTEALAGSSLLESLGEVVRLRRFWILVIVSISINVCWHFLANWLPTYLREDRKMTFVAGGLLSAVPFLAADVGNIGGGFLSRLLAGRGFIPSRARWLVMTGCAVLVTSGAWVGLASSDTVVIVLLATMALGTAAFMANYFAFTQEVSSRHTGLIVGILGGLGNLCAAGFLPMAGAVKDRTGGFGPIFVLVGLLPFLGIAALHFGWREDSTADLNGQPDLV